MIPFDYSALEPLPLEVPRPSLLRIIGGCLTFPWRRWQQTRARRKARWLRREIKSYGISLVAAIQADQRDEARLIAHLIQDAQNDLAKWERKVNGH